MVVFSAISFCLFSARNIGFAIQIMPKIRKQKFYRGKTEGLFTFPEKSAHENQKSNKKGSFRNC